MPQATKDNTKDAERGERFVVSVPAELATKIDAKIKDEGGEALANLGVDVSALRTGYTVKLLRDALA